MVAANTNRPIQNNLETLERLLQHTLQMDLLYVIPLQVECFSWEDLLVVVVQHPPQIVPNSHQVFHLLEQTIKSAHWSANQQVQIYLRITGEKEPYLEYACRLPRSISSVNLELNAGAVSGLNSGLNSDQDWSLPGGTSFQGNMNADDADDSWDFPADTADATDIPRNTGTGAIDENQNHATPDSDFSATVNNHLPPNPEIGADAPVTPRPIDLDALMRGEPQPEPVQPLQVEVYTPEPPNPEILATERLQRLRRRQRAKQLPFIFMGLAGAVLGAGLIGFVVLGKPCVMGKCEVIPQARQLTEKAQATLTPLASAKDIILAQKELEVAIASLREIPFWSSYFPQAQTDLKTYVEKAQKLDQIVIALKQATKAADMAKSLPIAEPQWQETQQVWREAIAQLESIPKEAQTYALAQNKITQYKENLRTVNLRLAEEQQATKTLKAAKETADIAQVRQGVAQFLTDWQEVTNNWRNAIARLEEIPVTTTAYAPAQELKQNYAPKLQLASDRTQQEQIAQRFFDQATKAATAAQKAGSENQWTLAANNWQNALDYIQQVQPNTSAATRTQPLVQSYSNSLKQAQANLVLASVRQRAKIDLDRTCKGNPPICTYEVVDNLIRVRLAASYTDQLRQSAIVATVRGDTKTHSGVIQHINTLQKALQAISQNNRLGLEIYDANGYLVSAYTPN